MRASWLFYLSVQVPPGELYQEDRESGETDRSPDLEPVQ